jgi:hypothetical protein
LLGNGVLVLSGERKLEREEKGRKYHRIERAYGSFGRSFSDGAPSPAGCGASYNGGYVSHLEWKMDSSTIRLCATGLRYVQWDLSFKCGYKPNIPSSLEPSDTWKRRHDYTPLELATWAAQIRVSGAKRVWTYFNNDRNGYAIKNARELRRQLSPNVHS